MRTAQARTMKRLAAVAAAGLAALPAAASGNTTVVPPISALPGALTANGALRSLPLGVALPAHPSTEAVRAAMIAAGAVARAQGGNGIRVFAAEGLAQSQIDQSPAPVVAIDETSGPGTLSLHRLPTGQLELTVSGGGRSLLAAARLLSSPWIRSLSGTTARIPAGVGEAAARTSATPAGATIAPASASGSRALTATSTFNMPVDQVVTKGLATLRVGVSYDGPDGGRVRIALNGNTLAAYNMPAGGGTFRVSSFKLSSNWTENGNLLPGYFLVPGLNRLTVSATPAGGRHRSAAVAHLTLDRGTNLQMTTAPRPSTEQLALWPFPFYGTQAWSHTTVVLSSKAPADQLSALISAMANAERITGTPSDPAVTYRAPTQAQRSQNLIVAGDPSLAAIAYNGPLPTGVLGEVRVIMGGTALVAPDPRGLGRLGYGYEPGQLNGRVVLIDAKGQSHTLVGAPQAFAYGAPARPWLLPAALIAVIVLGWVAVQAMKARRRLVELPDMPIDSGSVA